MEVNLVTEGLKFMVLGMLIVFVFLVVLVELMKIQAKLIGKFFPEKEVETTTPPVTVKENDKSHIAAIVAAVSDYRKNKS